MQDRFKYRVFVKNYCYVENGEYKYKPLMCNVHSLHLGTNKVIISGKYGNKSVILNENNILMQCTGLKDKNGLNLLFECDIINTEGIKIGNCYENEYLLKDTTNFVIKGMGTKEWRNSEQEAIKRGCYYAE